MALCSSNDIEVTDCTAVGKTHILGVDWKMKSILKMNTVEYFQRPEHIAVKKVQYRPPKTINLTTIYPVRDTKMCRMLSKHCSLPKEFPVQA